ncbi:MAG: porin family protein [Candidatus Krumholzibacteria bacterium]|nr:porin family protein [Candidatus Krumholzibacteria bacterium]
MKRFALVMFVVMAFAASASAQTMMAGLKGGLNIAKMTGDDVPDDASWLYGGAGGGYFTYKFSDMFAIQPEVLFMMKGFSMDVEDETYKMKLNYIDIPVLLKVCIPTEGSVKPSIFAGPYLGLLLSAKADDEDVKDYTKSMDYGVVFGGGINYMLAEDQGYISLDARYGMGLTTVDDSDDERDGKNMGITIMVGYGKSF